MATVKVSVRALARDLVPVDDDDDATTSWRASSTCDSPAFARAWTQGDVASDDGTTVRLMDADGTHTVAVHRARATTTTLAMGTYACARGVVTRATRSTERCELADAVVVGAEGEGRREAWAREVDESEAARAAMGGAVCS